MPWNEDGTFTDFFTPEERAIVQAMQDACPISYIEVRDFDKMTLDGECGLEDLRVLVATMDKIKASRPTPKSLPTP